MTQPTNPAQVPPFDGSSGNLLSRAEPKVRAASLTALLAPVVLYYLYEYVPGISSLPHQLDAVLGAAIVGALTFAAGFAAKAVDRVDLFARAEAAKLDSVVGPVLVKTFGEHAAEEIRHVAHEVYQDVVPPLEDAAREAVHGFEAAVGAGADPVSAARAEVTPLTDAAQDALDVAVADGRAEAPEVLAEAVSGAAEAHPEVAAQVAPVLEQAAGAVESNAELADMLRHMLALLEPTSDTPIGDAAAVATQSALPPVPAPAAPADPPTTEMPAINPATGTVAPTA